jgi:hypothetical protein
MKYFEVLVEIKTEIENKGGVKIKKVKESYLVDAMTVTEAEARVVKLFEKSGFSKDFEVIGVKGSKIVEVVEAPKDKPVKVTEATKMIIDTEKTENND